MDPLELANQPLGHQSIRPGQIEKWMWVREATSRCSLNEPMFEWWWDLCNPVLGFRRALSRAPLRTGTLKGLLDIPKHSAALISWVLTPLPLAHSARSCSATSSRCPASCRAWDQAGTLNVSVIPHFTGGFVPGTFCSDRTVEDETSCQDVRHKVGHWCFYL